MNKKKKSKIATRHRRVSRFWKKPHPYILLALVALVSWLFTLPVRPPNLNAAATPPAAPTPHSPIFGTTVTAVPYCYGQAMDLYGPRVMKYERSPVVMYIHGGGWYINTKSTEPDQLAMIDGLRDRGFTVVSIDYRLLPKNHFPAPLEDSLCAVRYLRAHADDYSLDSNRIAVYGFSAGGYLAGMVGVLDTNNDFTSESEPYHAFSSRVQAVVTLAGFFDLTNGLTVRNHQRIHELLQDYPPSTTDPVHFTTPDDPPFLLIHGTDDGFVQLEQDELMSERLQAAGVHFERLLVQHAQHGLESSGEPIEPAIQEVRQRVQDFIERFLFPYK